MGPSGRSCVLATGRGLVALSSRRLLATCEPWVPGAAGPPPRPPWGGAPPGLPCHPHLALSPPQGLSVL